MSLADSLRVLLEHGLLSEGETHNGSYSSCTCFQAVLFREGGEEKEAGRDRETDGEGEGGQEGRRRGG